MSQNTREQFLDSAQQLFARKGFYGASIAAVARELGLTKQALLHHFGSKEKLYGEVLGRISANLLAQSQAIVAAEAEPEKRLEALLLLQFERQMGDQDGARLIMRELLDNEQRAQRAGNWYLQPYLDLLLDTALETPRGRGLDRPQALAWVYQLLGAGHYFAVSQPTLEQMFGESALAKTRAAYREELGGLIRARLAAQSA